MLQRRFVFPSVIEMNYQARRRVGVNVYLIDGGDEFILIDVGFLEDTVVVLQLIRDMGYSFSACKMVVATHADVDHTQGLARARDVLKCPVAAHPRSVPAIESGDELFTFARIDAQGISIPMPKCRVDVQIDEGSKIQVGPHEIEVWSTPGHAAGQLAFKMGNLLFSGDNIFRDGCVGAIDAHHGSNIPDYIASLERIRDCDAEFLLPSHGPIFRKDVDLLNRTIDRLEGYKHMSDFGTCAVDWPLMDAWEDELIRGDLDF
ncbi:MBL fold metallo-hydrolase [Paludisphaera sp.]|uniref:MBL fold metallo-hydrolase n=1 Tax=Paludisphaera sp. TaxID=2017432 RepID=UPI00301BB7F0